jgi:hypothetical protein
MAHEKYKKEVLQAATLKLVLAEIVNDARDRSETVMLALSQLAMEVVIQQGLYHSLCPWIGG